MKDERGQPEGGDKDDLGYCFIPLVLWCQIEYSFPERVADHSSSSGKWRFDPPVDISQALTDEFKLSQPFEQPDYKNPNEASGLILAGTLRSTKYTATYTFYGLSLAGPLLHVLGLPMKTVKNDLSFELELVDQSTNEVLWKKGYSASHKITAWFLTFRFRTDFYYDLLLREMMPTIISDLATALQPNSLTSTPDVTPN